MSRNIVYVSRVGMYFNKSTQTFCDRRGRAVASRTSKVGARRLRNAQYKGK
jgi:hypothetical protein